MKMVLASACLLVAGSASAGRISYFEEFTGWSTDGTYYVMTVGGTDGLLEPIVCLSKRGVASPTWPKGVATPPADDETGCTDRWDTMFPDEKRTPEQVAAALADKAKSLAHGPAGETVTVKRADGEIVEIDVLRGGKRIARASIELKFASMSPPGDVRSYWRKDGATVAIALTDPPDPRAIGWGPPSFVVMLPLDGSTANAPLPPSRRQQAKALNIDGMKSLAAKQLDKAQKQFEAATDADGGYMLAYYNLACTASLRKDRDGSIKALRALAESDDKDAKQYLAKGLTDHDLDFIGTDPEGAKILKRKPIKK